MMNGMEIINGVTWRVTGSYLNCVIREGFFDMMTSGATTNKKSCDHLEEQCY